MGGVEWLGGVLGLAYRYYDLRMNVVPLFAEKREASRLWHSSCGRWADGTVRVRFVEDGGSYWFAAAGDSSPPGPFVRARLPASASYERFKRGCGGEAYLRFGTYARKGPGEARGGDSCACGHERDCHGESACLEEGCGCAAFDGVEVRLLRRKKTVTDVLFLGAGEAAGDPLAWNCTRGAPTP